MAETFRMMINGEQVNAAKTFEVKNPSTGEVVGLAPDASESDLDRAVAVADAAFQTWSQKSDAELQSACEAVTAKIGEHSEELATLVTKNKANPLMAWGPAGKSVAPVRGLGTQAVCRCR